MTIKEPNDGNASTQTQILNTNLQEVALQSLYRNLLKNQLFRGLYMERVHVPQLQQYRDKICLHTSEKEIKNKLINVTDKLQKFYDQQKCPIPWIGITGDIVNTYIWTEINDLAFGEYWFNIKNIKFNFNEIIVRVKAVRPIEHEAVHTGRSKAYNGKQTTENHSTNGAEDLTSQVDWVDFLNLPSMWLHSAKHNIYYFLSQDLNMKNVKELLKFLVLLLISLVSGLFIFIKFLGYFVIRFTRELSNLSTSLTPITIKIIDVIFKIIGGVFVFLAMIYRDCFGRNLRRSDPGEYFYRALPPSRQRY